MLHVRSNLQVAFLAHGIVELHGRHSLVVFNVWICLETKQDLDHLLVVIHYRKVESCAPRQISVVDTRVGLAKHSYHQRMIALCSPNESVLLELIELKHEKRI